jgi:hypothetical protein
LDRLAVLDLASKPSRLAVALKNIAVKCSLFIPIFYLLLHFLASAKVIHFE